MSAFHPLATTGQLAVTHYTRSQNGERNGEASAGSSVVLHEVAATALTTHRARTTMSPTPWEVLSMC